MLTSNKTIVFLVIFSIFHWDSLYTRLNSHYKAWGYQKNKKTNIKNI